MISGIPRKTIIYFFLFANFTKAGITAEFIKFEDDKIPQNNQPSWANFPSKSIKKPVKFFRNDEAINSLDKNQISDNIKSSSKQLQTGFNKDRDELLIQSQSQSEINNIIYAEGDVVVSYKGKFLKADSIFYDKLAKQISAQGNVSLIIGKQIFKLSNFA